MADTMTPSRIESLLAHLDDQEIIEFTQRLVRIPSVNGEEGQAAAFVAEACQGAGLQVSVRDVHDGRPNVLAVWPGDGETVGLLLHGHTDTVPFLNMRDPTSGQIEDGYIWGRGSVDQKGGLAASVMALLALARSGVRLAKGVAVAAVIDEESEHRGSMALVDDGLKADCAIVTEPSDLHLLVAHKGTAPIRIRFTGVLAHGSNPWIGVNAVEMASRTVMALKELELKSVEVPGIGTMRASFNVGLIEGGTAYNNVADSCALWLDRRMVPGEKQAMAIAEVEEVLSRLAADDPTFKAEAEIARPDWKWDRIRERGLNPSLTPPHSPVAQAVAAAHQAETGESVEVGYTHGYNDGDFMVNDLDIPTVNYGPGEGFRSHTVQEQLRIDHLLTAARVYLRTALMMAGGT
jgi:acetylornithine deacetylase/succinyl-diaminopimelate desuccinylase family protein